MSTCRPKEHIGSCLSQVGPDFPWLIANFLTPLDAGITIQNNSITPPTGQQSYAAIDTGTTLIGGPESYISQIFDQIPGSAPGTGSFENYYTYRKLTLSILPSMNY